MAAQDDILIKMVCQAELALATVEASVLYLNYSAANASFDHFPLEKLRMTYG